MILLYNINDNIENNKNLDWGKILTRIYSKDRIKGRRKILKRRKRERKR